MAQKFKASLIAILTSIVVFFMQMRNAFGNYRDVMKEVSYSPVMGDMLTYVGSQSTAFVLEDEGNLEYADEKYV